MAEPDTPQPSDEVRDDLTIRTEKIQAQRETIHEQGLSMLAMGRELREKDAELARLHSAAPTTTPRQAALETIVEAICPFIRWGDESGHWSDLQQAPQWFVCEKDCPSSRGCRVVAELAARAALDALGPADTDRAERMLAALREPSDARDKLSFVIGDAVCAQFELERIGEGKKQRVHFTLSGGALDFDLTRDAALAALHDLLASITETQAQEPEPE